MSYDRLLGGRSETSPALILEALFNLPQGENQDHLFKDKVWAAVWICVSGRVGDEEGVFVDSGNEFTVEAVGC